MTKTISMKNIETDVLYIPEIRKKIQHKYADLFKAWSKSKQFPEHRSKGTQACIDLLNKFDEQDLNSFEEFYKQKVRVQRFYSNQTRHINTNKLNTKDILNKEVTFCKTFFPYLDGNELLIYIWS